LGDSLKFRFEIERDIKQLKDLEGLSEEQCLEVFLKMGVQFDMTDEQLLNYSCMGEKRFARARDECLRRKLISKVGE